MSVRLDNRNIDVEILCSHRTDKMDVFLDVECSNLIGKDRGQKEGEGEILTEE